MPLPWKKSKSGRISRFVSDFQQSPKHGGSLVVETGFPTSLIDLFVKNRDRLKKQSSKRKDNNNNKTPPIHSIPTRQQQQQQQRVLSPPSPPPSIHRHRSLPVKLDDPSSLVTDVPAIDESFVDNDGGFKTEDDNKNDAGDDGGRNGGGGCGLMVVAFKVFVVAVLALSTKRLAVGITLSAFSLIFLEFAVARVFTLLNLCPHARGCLGSFIGKIFGEKKEQREEEEKVVVVESPRERKNRVTFEIFEESKDCNEEIQDLRMLEKEEEEREVVLKKEKSKSSKLKSKIVKKIVPKKLRGLKKKKKMKSKEKEEEIEVIEVIGEGEDYGEEEEEEEESVTEVSSLFSDDRIGSEVSERDEVSSNPTFLESCCEEIEEEEEEGGGRKGHLTKAMVLIVIVLAGLLNGKVVAIGLTLSSCLILKLVCNNKSQTSL